MNNLLPENQKIADGYLHYDSPAEFALAIQQATAEKCAELIRIERDNHDAGTRPWCALSQALAVEEAFRLET